MNQKFKSQYTTGFAKEQELMSLLNDIKDQYTEIKESTDQEDIHQHIDFTLTKTYNIDVKSLKKKSRSESEVQEDEHYIEVKNVLGQKGWCYSEHTTHFVFETLDSWVVVTKEELQALVKRKVKKEFVTNVKDCLYKLYTRQGRQDVITKVKTIDLMNVSCEIILKKDDNSSI